MLPWLLKYNNFILWNRGKGKGNIWMKAGCFEEVDCWKKEMLAEQERLFRKKEKQDVKLNIITFSKLLTMPQESVVKQVRHGQVQITLSKKSTRALSFSAPLRHNTS